MRAFVPLLAIVLLVACDAEGTGELAATDATPGVGETAAAPEATPSPPDEPAAMAMNSGEADDSRCGADKLKRWMNVLPTESVKEEIAATVGDRPIRYYKQGDPITMDFSPARLNVELGEDGRIKLFRCG